jgi:Trk K+ transport system NAD-binding subunit
MSAVPLVLVVGGDKLAVRVCKELHAMHGHRAAVVWMHDHSVATKFEEEVTGAGTGCSYVRGAPNDVATLQLAGVARADAIMVLSDDDRLNLQVALTARDLNANIRIVMRQFSRTLGVKLQQNLPNSSVLSLASYSAAAFAAASIDPSCAGALQFPDPGGVLTAFATRTAKQFGIAELTAVQAESQLCARIVAVNGAADAPRDEAIAESASVTVFARIEHLETRREPGPPESVQRVDDTSRWAALFEHVRSWCIRQKIVLRVIVAAAAIFIAACAYFAYALNLDPVTAFYFVATTFTSTGYGDVTPIAPAGNRLHAPDRAAMIVAGLLMFAGVASIGIFIAFATSGLTRVQFTALQGLRQIRTRGHVLVIGCGSVGTRVVEFLRALDRHVVVVERKSDPMLEEMSSRRGIQLVTGDATRDATLELCNVAHARAVIAVTDSDTANLEVALGVGARNTHVPVVMRVQDEAFAESIKHHFKTIDSFSTVALAAPMLAMTSRFPETRGWIALGGASYNVAERSPAGPLDPTVTEGGIPLGVWRNGAFLHIDEFRDTKTTDRLLYLKKFLPFEAVLPANGEAVAVRTT